MVLDDVRTVAPRIRDSRLSGALPSERNPVLRYGCFISALYSSLWLGYVSGLLVLGGRFIYMVEPVRLDIMPKYCTWLSLDTVTLCPCVGAFRETT